MTCKEIENLAPLYLSGELDEGQRAQFQTHLAQCRSCAAEMDQQAALDARLRHAASAELADATAIVRRVRGRMGAERAWGFAAVAAVLLFAAAMGYRALRPEPVGRLYADAALDHRLEVMEHQPRRWRSDPVEIDKLAARFQMSNVDALAPSGYRLEHAKICGIDGKPALHLVYTNGSREVSVFVRARSQGDLRAVSLGSENLVAFRTDHLEAVVATNGSRSECQQFAQFASRAL